MSITIKSKPINEGKDVFATFFVHNKDVLSGQFSIEKLRQFTLNTGQTVLIRDQEEIIAIKNGEIIYKH